MTRTVARERVEAKRSWDFSLRDQLRDRKAAKALSSRDCARLIGEPKERERRERATGSLRSFLLSYFPETFELPFAPFHDSIINTIEKSLNEGESFCLACPRSSGKTSICKGAIIWAIATGRSKFCVLVASSAQAGAQIVQDVEYALRFNERLYEDFPEMCVQWRVADGKSRSFPTLTYNGEPMNASCAKDSFQLGKIPGALCSEAIVKGTGLQGSGLRGLSVTTSNGVQRPDFILLDDPQDRESAQSVSQTEKRERIIQADIAGMAGVKKAMSIICTCTVIEKDDLADRLLNPELHPEFKGQKYALLPTLPSFNAMELWKKYKEIRASEYRNGGDGSEARAFYHENWEEMHDGATVAWPERKGEKDLDALEYAMKLYLFQGEEAFFSEYQNDPLSRDEKLGAITADLISVSCNKLKRSVVPHNKDSFVTAFIDCHKQLLFYSVVSWSREFGGHLLDYGTYPKQARRDFTLRDATRTIENQNKELGFELAFKRSLDELVNELFSASFSVEGDGEENEIKLDRLMIDANWGETTDLVYEVASRSPYRSLILPSHGMYVGAKTQNFHAKIKKGSFLGSEWAVARGRLGQKYVVFNTNFWKTTLYNRFVSQNGNNRFSVYGEANEHFLLAKHLQAEKPVTVEANGRRVDEWVAQKNADNHWLDCLVGSAVCASVCGAKLEDEIVEVKAKKPSKRSKFLKSLRDNHG